MILLDINVNINSYFSIVESNWRLLLEKEIHHIIYLDGYHLNYCPMSLLSSESINSYSNMPFFPFKYTSNL